MPLPRPASPRALWADLRTFAAERRPHHWMGVAVALVMPIAIVILFIVDGRTNIAPGRQIQFVDSWPATRTDAEIIADQKKDQAAREKAQKERQAEYKKLDDKLERLGL
jgi:hypothetical protein